MPVGFGDGHIRLHVSILFFRSMILRSITCAALYLLAIPAASAQSLLQAITPTTLQAAPSDAAPARGLFTRGGVVFNPTDVGGGWLRITAENGDTGYVLAARFRSTLNAADTHEPDPAPFIPGTDGIMGCPHLFVRAASLHGRTAPRADAKTAKMFYTHDPVCVAYLPADTDGWVRVEGHFDDDAGIFVQRKFLGPRFRADSVMGVYDGLRKRDTATRRFWIERLVELAWKEEVPMRIAALERTLAFATEIGEERATAQARFELHMSRAMLNPYTGQELAAQAASKTFSLELGGYKTGNGAIPFADLKMISGTYHIVRDSLPECGAEADARYQYPSLSLWAFEHEKSTAVDWIDLSAPGNACIVAGFRIERDTDERDFVQALGRYFSVHWTDAPHEYFFGFGESRLWTITFRDGKPWRHEEIYIC